ncbi:hypothetical protein SAMN05216532_8589 [Streptomyces sp. 2231.1]|nr:hypothetical protein SAMN05216532_8589 [Streptomyces sp. 2231.1]
MTDSGKRRVTIKLADVVCRDTEDVLGADEFFIAGAVVNYTPNSSLKKLHKPTATKPIIINTGQTRFFPEPGATVFDAVVGKDSYIDIGWEGRDEDFETGDFVKEYEVLLGAITTAVGTAVGTLVSPGVGTVAGAILGAIGPAVLKALPSVDKPDLLGIHAAVYHVAKLKLGRTRIEFPLQGKSWDYKVGYTIDCGITA